MACFVCNIRFAYAKLSIMQGTQSAAVTAIRIRLVIANRGVSWLAEQVGISDWAMRRRMAGNVTFDIELLDQIAQVFGTSLEGLLSTADAIELSA